MSDPYMSQIHMVGFNWAPRNYALCSGQILAVSQYQALFSLLGNQYGGDGISTFGLPNLCGRTPVGQSGSQRIGSYGGYEYWQLNPENLPSHTHQVQATTNQGEGSSRSPVFGKLLAMAVDPIAQYRNDKEFPVTLNPAAVKWGGGDAGHNNMQPSLVINFIISLAGYYPSRP